MSCTLIIPLTREILPILEQEIRASRSKGAGTASHGLKTPRIKYDIRGGNEAMCRKKKKTEDTITAISKTGQAKDQITRRHHHRHRRAWMRVPQPLWTLVF